MSKEFELVVHDQLQHVNAFLVRLQERVMHIHKELELGYILDGQISLCIQQNTSQLTKGDLFIVNRMEPHELFSEGNGALILAIQFSPKLTEGFQKPGTHYRYRGNPNLREALAEQPSVYQALCAACVELTYSFLRQEENDEFRCFSLSASLVYSLHKVLPWDSLTYDDYSTIKQRANRIMAITNYVDQNFQRKLLLGELAEKENLSLSYLSHFFKDTLGMTFQDYLNKKRFEYACQLLFTTDRKILDISASSGFSDTRYFNEAFAAQYSCTPKEYRKGRSITRAQPHQLEKNTQYFFTQQDALLLLDALRQRTAPLDLSELIR